MEPKRDMDERVNSDANPLDLIREFLHMAPRDESDDCGDEDSGVELAPE